MASANSGCASQCADQVVSGEKPRLILCSPCVPGSKTCLPVVDAVVDSLVVAGFEMQCVVVTVAAPVTPVEYLFALKKYGGRDRLAIFFGENDQNVFRQLLADRSEELLIEVGQGTALHERAADQCVNDGPQLRRRSGRP